MAGKIMDPRTEPRAIRGADHSVRAAWGHFREEYGKARLGGDGVQVAWVNNLRQSLLNDYDELIYICGLNRVPKTKYGIIKEIGDNIHKFPILPTGSDINLTISDHPITPRPSWPPMAMPNHGGLTALPTPNAQLLSATRPVGVPPGFETRDALPAQNPRPEMTQSRRDTLNSSIASVSVRGSQRLSAGSTS